MKTGSIASARCPTRTNDNEAAAVAAHRWWSLPDLRNSTDRFFPEGLVEIFERLREHGLVLTGLHPGSWCGREEFMGFQDVLIAVRDA